MIQEYYYTYVLYAPQRDKIYIGFSVNPAKRFIAHNHPNNRGYTSKFKPWILIHVEKFSTKQEAMNREKQLKSHKGRDFIRDLLADLSISKE